jgi:quinoprotein glucose dehydrogenase
VALHAKTGTLAWAFQLVHHDLWDYDTAAAPLLATIERDGKQVPVVVQGNKTGFLYVLNRDTGVPVFPVEERAVPQSDVPGEMTSPTQPFPTAPPALVRQHLSADDAWGPTAMDREFCRTVVASCATKGSSRRRRSKGRWQCRGIWAGCPGAGMRLTPRAICWW